MNSKELGKKMIDLIDMIIDNVDAKNSWMKDEEKLEEFKIDIENLMRKAADDGVVEKKERYEELIKSLKNFHTGESYDEIFENDEDHYDVVATFLRKSKEIEEYQPPVKKVKKKHESAHEYFKPPQYKSPTEGYSYNVVRGSDLIAGDTISDSEGQILDIESDEPYSASSLSSSAEAYYSEPISNEILNEVIREAEAMAATERSRRSRVRPEDPQPVTQRITGGADSAVSGNQFIAFSGVSNQEIGSITRPLSSVGISAQVEQTPDDNESDDFVSSDSNTDLDIDWVIEN